MPRGKNYVNQNKGMRLQAASRNAVTELCFYGAACNRPDCIYRHEETEFVQSQEPCMAFLAGICSFEAKTCRKRHPNAQESELLIQKYSTKNCKFGESCHTKGCLYRHQAKPSLYFCPPANSRALPPPTTMEAFPPLGGSDDPQAFPPLGAPAKEEFPELGASQSTPASKAPPQQLNSTLDVPPPAQWSSGGPNNSEQWQQAPVWQPPATNNWTSGSEWYPSQQGVPTMPSMTMVPPPNNWGAGPIPDVAPAPWGDPNAVPQQWDGNRHTPHWSNSLWSQSPPTDPNPQQQQQQQQQNTASFVMPTNNPSSTSY